MSDGHQKQPVTLAEVRELVRALGAHLSIELEDRLAKLEKLIRERRTIIVRRPKKESQP